MKSSSEPSFFQFMQGKFQLVLGIFMITPVNKLLQTIFKIYTRLPSKESFYVGNISITVADIKFSDFVCNIRLKIAFIEPDKRLCHFFYGYGMTCSNIENLIIGLISLKSGNIGGCDVFDVNKISSLSAIFVDDRRFSIFDSTHKYSSHSIVGIGETLSRPVDIKISKCNCGNVVGLSNVDDHFFLIFLTDRINRI